MASLQSQPTKGGPPPAPLPPTVQTEKMPPPEHGQHVSQA